ncbi:hypothetical protein DOTSEDRAFT_133597 [Dothistroma septosporum NZE10]|uniref:CBF1-interacting co-repressor CIR N-terminal domain-containing protein n=1 Tax=Dothistroma septosporum (strain NZE10 / CBS 128990) TaxID=675120 RepID=N1PMA7_DOTSN|nr:hypothetical protein DOTSEDRAFT_133597 [Dothistroma septosporum NZE10]
MPLHLLGKKSWNVYNADNVEKVRRDEAEAKAREEAAEQRMQEEDAARRIALLRGEEPPTLTTPGKDLDGRHDWRASSRDEDQARRERKRRRLRGEDDTDRDIRYAKEDTDASQKASKPLLKEREKDAPLEDHAGHIQLFSAPDERDLRKAEKNAEAEAEKVKKRKREEDQVTMRFSNAAGSQKPWYAAANERPASTATTDLVLAEVQGKDVWGNEDSRRKEREQNRISSSDPFASMQTAQRQLKQSERDKEKWQQKQQAEIAALKRAGRCRKERHRHRREDEVDSLDGFSLDAPEANTRERSDHDRHRRRGHHHHRHRRHSRSRSGERDRHRSRHRPS